MRKLSAKWVPVCLNADQKRQSCQSTERLFKFFRCDPNDFLSARFVTMDENSFCHCDPETKLQTMELWHSVSSSPKISGFQKSAGKVLALIFWDQDGILLRDYFPKGQPINAENYSSLLVQLNDILKEKHGRKFTKEVLLLQEFAPAQRALATQKKLTCLSFYCLDHPLYSPNLALSELHLFPRLKKQLKGRHFLSDVEVIDAEETWSDEYISEYF
jgi:histone-lysine N-methyltransferase SETMAR